MGQIMNKRIQMQFQLQPLKMVVMVHLMDTTGPAVQETTSAHPVAVGMPLHLTVQPVVALLEQVGHQGWPEGGTRL